MVRKVRDFAEACRHGLGISVGCRGCGKRMVFRAADLMGHVRPGADVEKARWRCTWCRGTSVVARYCPIDDFNREALSQWRPPKGRARRF